MSHHPVGGPWSKPGVQAPWPACAASPGAHTPALATLEGSHQSVLPQSTCRAPSIPSCSGQRHRALPSLRVPHPAHCSGCFLDFSFSSTHPKHLTPFSRATIYKERSPHLERSFLLLQGGQYCFSKHIFFIGDQFTRPCQKLCISVFCHLPAHCIIICQLHWQLFHASFGRNIKKPPGRQSDNPAHQTCATLASYCSTFSTDFMLPSQMSCRCLSMLC